MSFLEQVPTHVETLNSEIKKLGSEMANIEWGHDCDCEYCDRENEIGEEAQEEYDRLKLEVASRKRMIARLEAYAQLWNKVKE